MVTCAVRDGTDLMYRIPAAILLALLALVLTGAAQAQPQYRTYAPVVLRADRCGDVSPKKGLAWSWQHEYPQDHHRLCLPPSFKWFKWAPLKRSVDGVQITPMVWSDRDLDTWCTKFAGYDDFVLFANEPLLENQADMTAVEVAQLAADINACTPAARLVGPNMHPTVNEYPQFMATFWTEYKARGGDPGALVANGFHVYYGPAMAQMSADEMIDRYLELLPAEVRDLPLWITEVGYRNGWPDPYDGAQATFAAVDAHPQVAYWFGYAPRGDYGYEFIDWSDQMTPVGRAFRDVGSAYPGPGE